MVLFLNENKIKKKRHYNAENVFFLISFLFCSIFLLISFGVLMATPSWSSQLSQSIPFFLFLCDYIWVLCIYDGIFVQPISITKTLLIVPTKNESNPPLFTGKLLIKFQNILRNNTQVIIRHRVKILFSVISSPITLEWQMWKSSKMNGILLSSPVSCW